MNICIINLESYLHMILGLMLGLLSEMLIKSPPARYAQRVVSILRAHKCGHWQTNTSPYSQHRVPLPDVRFTLASFFECPEAGLAGGWGLRVPP